MFDEDDEDSDSDAIAEKKISETSQWGTGELTEATGRKTGGCGKPSDRQRKNDCYAVVESGLWGWQCKSSAIAKENCALKCLSPACYELVYEVIRREGLYQRPRVSLLLAKILNW
ncbi:hypothetical protein MLD38_037390 [Melastoma candidum]|uniref:Uncharacterized protein n=1 Tax=Melastoma candidum TaxID=119954 RepID=A0ACB9LMK0_9MYRT|nr:hypothetical protein MLD38_037390 [Melastoma candidum]